METKKFICRNFQPNPSCEYEVEGPEDEVIDIAVDHLIAKHEFMDSPQLREDIRASLV